MADENQTVNEQIVDKQVVREQTITPAAPLKPVVAVDGKTPQQRAEQAKETGLPTVAESDAMRARMVPADWDKLTDEQRAAHRRLFPRTDAQRAGLTASQWNVLSESEKAAFRALYSDPASQPIPVPSPPDVHAMAAAGFPGRVLHAAYNIPADPEVDSFEGLLNTPGGRNCPTMSYFDPGRDATA